MTACSRECRQHAALGLVLGTLSLAIRAGAQTASPEFVRAGDLQGDRVGESSGLAYSRRGDAVWTHGDSGNPPVLFAFDLSGRELGAVTLADVRNVDWEDLASAVVDGRPLLFIADIGDNDRERSEYVIHAVEEPPCDPANPGSAAVAPAWTIRFVYEDGPLNAEALAVDAEARKLYLIRKRGKLRADVYELPFDAPRDDRPAVARRIARLPIDRVTAADLSADGAYFAVLNKEALHEYRRQDGENWSTAFAREPDVYPLPGLPQAEAVCYSPDGSTAYVTSEGLPTPLWSIRLRPAAP